MHSGQVLGFIWIKVKDAMMLFWGQARCLIRSRQEDVTCEPQGCIHLLWSQSESLLDSPDAGSDQEFLKNNELVLSFVHLLKCLQTQFCALSPQLEICEEGSKSFVHHNFGSYLE